MYEQHYDVVVVGSGFAGAVAALRLSEKGYRVAVLEEGGYRTLNDIIDLEREDLLRLPGIAPEEADRIITMLDELTEEGGEEAGADEGAGEGTEPPRRGES